MTLSELCIRRPVMTTLITDHGVDHRVRRVWLPVVAGFGAAAG